MVCRLLSRAASVIVEHRLNSYDTGFVALWHASLPISGIEPVSPALASESFTTEPPGKPLWDLDVIKLLSKKKKKQAF